ncbi:hypothetical protein GMA11_07455 [Granulicatella sp. zg-ZJ]|uniref:hypothetical protein n=1 Tax=Granulicatella sp. zg-ZJ TaxID=2678504 RepID=UPI0013D3E7D4|nr:hypothetical protein [Granulicatella sp. zg-ZJ]MBS4751118.1 hypothetical protein [Carnobacteriaceae bacterium zg-ZUI78]NEW63229.1 hypothetical protein [Granulicatella sp. zg-ZJ]
MLLVINEHKYTYLSAFGLQKMMKSYTKYVFFTYKSQVVNGNRKEISAKNVDLTGEIKKFEKKEKKFEKGVDKKKVCWYDV